MCVCVCVYVCVCVCVCVIGEVGVSCSIMVLLESSLSPPPPPHTHTQDFFLTIAIGLLYLISCIAWSAGAAQLNSFVSSTLQDYGMECLLCSQPSGVGVQSFAQPAISLVRT